MSNKQNNDASLKRSLNPMHVWAIAFVCVIGWGSFINLGKKFLSNSGGRNSFCHDPRRIGNEHHRIQLRLHGTERFEGMRRIYLYQEKLWEEHGLYLWLFGGSGLPYQCVNEFNCYRIACGLDWTSLWIF